jgi:5-methylcytosine-specific restriction endonuclease McrA
MTTRSGSSRPDLDTGQWKRIRAAVRRRDGNACVVCGSTTKLHVHHVTPARLGGDDSMDNLVTLCALHHRQADAKLRRRGRDPRVCTRTLRRRPRARHLLGSAERARRNAATMVEALVDWRPEELGQRNR